MQSEIGATTWDEGVISEFMQTAVGNAYDTENGHTLILFTDNTEKESIGSVLATEMAHVLAWLGVPRYFHVLLWWREDPRYVQANQWPTKRQVNGGWTRAGSSVVCIYRSEEWERVLLHEMIHALEWDWKMPTRPLSCWGLGDKAETSPALFEAWTELYAEWLWCAWTGTPWQQQRKWQKDQAVQVLARQNGRDWSEDTSVFAYYVLKAALAPHIAFLILHGNGDSTADRYALLCRLAAPELAELRAAALAARPRAISMRMTTSNIRASS